MFHLLSNWIFWKRFVNGKQPLGLILWLHLNLWAQFFWLGLLVSKLVHSMQAFAQIGWPLIVNYSYDFETNLDFNQACYHYKSGVGYF